MTVQNTPEQNIPVEASAISSNARPPAIEKLKLRLVDAFCAITIFVMICRGMQPGSQNVDELVGLYNQTYSAVPFHKLDPLPFFFPYITIVHPPLQDIVLGVQMLAGIGTYYACFLPLFALSLLLVFFVRSSSFPWFMKIAVLFGYLACFEIDGGGWSTTTVRPDVYIATGWWAGLVALEKGRQNNWNERTLFFGGLVLAYASALHYPAWPATGALFVYALAMLAALGMRRAWPKMLAMFGGASVVILPYAILFVIPNWARIRQVAAVIQTQGAAGSAIARHFARYDLFASGYALGDNLDPIRGWLGVGVVEPLARMHLPFFILGAALLLILKPTRLIALASLPLTAFIFLYSRGKSTGYFLPETIVLFTSLAAMALFLADRAVRRLTPVPAGVIAALCAASLATIVLADHPFLRFSRLSVTPQTDEMHLARACSQRMIGQDALIGGRVCVWYAAGAHAWYDVSPDLFWNNRLPADIHDYFSHFDVLAENPHMADVVLNPENASLGTWYADGTLDLRGFYLSSLNPHLCFLLFSTHPTPSIRGFFCRDGRELFQFDQQPAGDFVFVTATMLAGNHSPYLAADTLIPPAAHALMVSAIGLPAGHKFSPPVPEGITEFLVSAICPRSNYEAWKQQWPATCVIRDEIPGRLVAQDAASVLAAFWKKDRPMVFYDGLPERPLSSDLGRFVVASPSTTGTAIQLAPVGATSTLPLELLQPCYPPPQMSARQSGGALTVLTPSGQFAYALKSPALTVESSGDYVFDLTYHLTDGRISFGALTGDESHWIAQSSAAPSPLVGGGPRLFCSRFTLRLHTGDSIHLLLTNNNPAGDRPSELTIDSLSALLKQ
jgi:hypothetical protein